MIAQTECRECYGHGYLHSAGRNGDPFDNGVKCRACDGAGVVDVDLEDECDE